MKHILITGGTGLVGKKITELLLAKGYAVAYLSRKKQQIPSVKVYEWNIYQKSIEKEAITEAEAIIHLAGAGVADKSWTESYKKEILESRVLSTRLLYETLQQTQHSVKSFISASAIGIYGFDTGEQWLDENSPHGTGFLADVTAKWETEVQKIADLGIRTAILRIGIVLAKEGGALPKLLQPIRWGLGAALGSGKQYMSWIHIKDLAQMFVFALENENLQGVFNAVGNDPCTNTELIQKIAQILKKPLFLPNIPSFTLKLMVGEMAQMVLGGNRVSNEKILKAGFQYQFTTLKDTLQDLLG
ncbi:TIGR01777 family oxidoreductase [Raineya orbicola]|jgi:uncharacterized protein (TIGR01777 family)|uniref:YfcH: TIGR01777 family protein n=1 Tax=Raineya orbicola TaxID=2016530 RepID=A0A2N3IIV8_9BACT|nr:TIGR01777 family oxidoreductase [Raineya orbicola]PKQ70163.1 yfcH: TIGR01777 family protein [Raineya orbicola]